MLVQGPLNGIRVLDLTHVWAGPLAARILSDLGAELIKIESPLARGPREPTVEPLAGWLGGEPGEEPWNNMATIVKLARNRKSVCINLKRGAGKQLFLKLVEQADVVIENFSARAMPSLGLSYDVMTQHNPRLIYVSMPGYGSSGPYKDWVAFGPTVEPMTGFTQMFGYSPEEPRNTAMALMDPIAGTSATNAVLTALRQRENDGKGKFVELSLHEAGVSFNGPWLIDHQFGLEGQSLGNAHPEMCPHGVYRCRDAGHGDDADWIAIACENDDAWSRLSHVLGCPDMSSWDLEMRRNQADSIDEQIGKWTSRFDKHEAAEMLQEHGIASGPVSTAPELLCEPQAVDRNFFVNYERFDTPIPGNPIRMAGLDSLQWTPCPRLGEHNKLVLQDWLGLASEDVEGLLSDGIIFDQPPA